MLANLKWPSLENRKKISCLILLFKILRKLLISTPLENTHAHHMLKLTHIQSRIDIYRYLFLRIPRTITLWNNRILDIQDIEQISFTT